LRKPPIKHTVHRHIRMGKPVRTYERGKNFLQNKYTKKLIAVRSKQIINKDQPLLTPSGKDTSDNLCKLSKGQTLLWQGKSGSERVIMGYVTPRMKTRFCTICDEPIQEGEEVVMTQDYFPFRHYMVVHNVFHKRHFPFWKGNLLGTEEAIDKYMNTERERDYPPEWQNKGYKEYNTIYDLEQDCYHGKFKK
jgi:hypothetical protein